MAVGNVSCNVKKVVWVALLLLVAIPAFARDIQYSGGEEVIYVRPGEPTQVAFPAPIEGGYKRKNSALGLEHQDKNLVIFAQQSLGIEGEAIILTLADKRTYALRVVPATGSTPKDVVVKVLDAREPDMEEEGTPEMFSKEKVPFARTTAVAGLMREMILVAEFGKKKGIPGYRRSNRYSGEVVLHDGAIEATIDEIFMGTDLWGYVISVENLLETNQRLNPATFRLDGTRAVVAQRWELSPRPLTTEQQVAKEHQGKIYIITRAKRQ
jgi:hypothetical protein